MPSFFFHVALDLERAPDDRPRATDLSKTSEQALPISTQESPSSSGHFDDWRLDRIFQETIPTASMTTRKEQLPPEEPRSLTEQGISTGSGGLSTKGKFEPFRSTEEEIGWGIVRLYRDANETPGLDEDPLSHKAPKAGRYVPRKEDEVTAFKDEDCTTLCILAVPSYLTPSDFLGFVGEKTRDEVSHFRMIRSEKSNRYMVLMKFRNGKKARQWKKVWNGKTFDDVGSEHCQVVFVKSISLQIPSETQSISSFPDMTHDPFTPSITTSHTPSGTSPSQVTSNAKSAKAPRPLNKPAPPPTPSLIELPTCPVCLERMDETTGLLTILCQHVFHCTCLQKWKGGGCPVCRYTHSSISQSTGRDLLSTNSKSLAEIDSQPSNACSVCHSSSNLWVCLICGYLGCGRYDGAHAFQHYEQSSHSFSMELSSQRVWDYASDAYVHRIIQDQTDGSFVELTHPSDYDLSRRNRNHDRPNQDSRAPSGDGHDDASNEDEYVPRSKLTSIGLEYTSLLTSQLESQRTYYQEILSASADKAASATSAAESASAAAERAELALASLRSEHEGLLKETVPSLEKDCERTTKRAQKFEGMARHLEREWRDEKAMSEGLRQKMANLENEISGLKEKVRDLEDERRDLQFFITGGEKLKEIAGATGDQANLEGGTVEVAPPVAPSDTGAGKGKTKGKGKDRKR